MPGDIRLSDDAFTDAFLDRLTTETMASEDGERLAVRLRRQFLEEVSYRRLDSKALPLLSALAIYCAHAEYVMDETPEETAAVAALDPGRSIAAGLVRACYRKDETEILPLDEIRSVGAIADRTSREVQAMYEHDPYPPWQHLGAQEPVDDAPDILVAGCGSGHELLTLARIYPRSILTGIDLSRVSLAYTLLRAREHGIDNVALFHADILDVAALGKRFDSVRSSGVLHHMREPAKGLAALRDVLKPGGAMKIRMYSRAARADVFAARDLARRGGYPATRDGIRAFRRMIYALPHSDPARGIVRARDFYSFSGLRDMVFHVQEHTYTIRELARLVEDVGFEIVKFGSAKSLRFFHKMGFNDDTDLSAWEKTEAAYPETFRSMYSVTLTKPA